MPKRTSLTTHEYLINAALPPATDTYTVISHEAIINETRRILAEKGFPIEREFYKCNEGANVAQGVYHLKFGDDPDMGMLFAWNNSYDKSMKFKCSIGGFVHGSLASVVGANIGTFSRKHTGTADNEAFEMIQHQLDNAEEYFKQLVADKDAMKTITVCEETRAQLMGVLYFVHEVLTGEQLSIARTEFNKPSFVYGGVIDSLWYMYNGVIFSLQKAHPRTWMDQQKLVHWFLCEQFKSQFALSVKSELNGITDENTVADTNQNPNQLSIIDEIAMIEATGMVPVLNDPAVINESPEEGKAESNPIVIEWDNEGNPLMSASFEIIDFSQPKVEEVEELVGHSESEVFNETPFDINIPEPKAWNPEDAIKEASEKFPETMEKLEDVLVAEDDNTWPCMSCGESQGPTDAWHDGQICTKCNSKTNEI